MVCNCSRHNKNDRKLMDRYDVLVDGHRQPDVNYVDARRRLVRIIKRNEQGHFYVTPQGSLADEWIHARSVRFVRKNES